MKRRLIALLTFLLIFSVSFSQEAYIKGKITSQSTGSALSNCSVFINNSSRGTVSDASGQFELRGVPVGKHELIVSSIGYETYALSFSENQLPLNLNIQLKLKAAELEAVTVAPYVENGWRKWGTFFLDNFIGTTKNSSYCTIKNTKVIRFRFSEKRNVLTATADEPLIIENKALGYTITYQLEEFSSNFNEKSIAYFGYPLFKTIPTKRPNLEKRWNENRKEAYHGSVVHFMKSLYYDELAEQGFVVRPHIKIENTEKTRVSAIYVLPEADTSKIDRNSVVQINKSGQIPKDSLAYYQKVMQQPDFFNALGPVITADSLVTLNGDGEHVLFFNGTISIYYSNAAKTVDRRSSIHLTTPSPVVIDPSGMYYPPQEVYTMGDWGFSEKLDNLLPSDYEILE